MFNRAVVFIPLLIAATCISGCKIESSVPAGPDAESAKISALNTPLSRAGAPLPEGGARLNAEPFPDTAEPEMRPGAVAEVAKRIEDKRRDWENREEPLPDAHRPGPDGDNGSVTYKFSSISPEVMAVERKFSTQRLNLRIEIRLLESRILSAGEPEKSILIEKLNKTRAEQESVEEEYRAEIERVTTPPTM